MFKLGLLVLAFLGLSPISKGQAKTFVEASIATSNSVMYQNVEIGATTGKNRLSVLIETFTPRNDFSVDSNRQYFGGVRYTRGVAVGKHLDLLMSCAAKIRLSSNMALSIEPGIGLGYNVSKRMAFFGLMTSPIHENTTPFKQLQLKAGVGVQVKI